MSKHRISVDLHDADYDRWTDAMTYIRTAVPRRTPRADAVPSRLVATAVFLLGLEAIGPDREALVARCETLLTGHLQRRNRAQARTRALRRLLGREGD